MKKTLSLLLITLFVVSAAFAGGPDGRPRHRRRRRGIVKNVSITKVIEIKPNMVRQRRRRVVVRVHNRVKPAFFYKYVFSKADFSQKFPNGIEGPVKVKIHVSKTITRRWTPRNADRRAMQVPQGGFTSITYVSKILAIVQ